MASTEPNGRRIVWLITRAQCKPVSGMLWRCLREHEVIAYSKMSLRILAAKLSCLLTIQNIWFILTQQSWHRKPWTLSSWNLTSWINVGKNILENTVIGFLTSQTLRVLVKEEVMQRGGKHAPVSTFKSKPLICCLCKLFYLDIPFNSATFGSMLFIHYSACMKYYFMRSRENVSF